MNEKQAKEYLKQAAMLGSRPGLLRVEELLHLCGDPQDGLNVIHVTGTNGKGSVCAMLQSVLRQAGYKVGLFTSPYIWQINECIRLNGENISDGELAEAVEYAASYADGMEAPPTEFELLLTMALCFFVKEHCDLVILEAGMGGLMDATNVTKRCLLSIITNVELDHTAFLGSTLSEIAFQKAGLIKRGCPVIWGGEQQEAAEVVRHRAEEMDAPLTVVDETGLQKVKCTLEGCTFDFHDLKEVRLPLPGLYQPKNAAIALTAVSVLRERGLPVSDAAVICGLQQTVWYGRFEILCQPPLMIYDGAHNIAGMTMAVQSIRHYFGGRSIYVLMGVMADKDYEHMVEMLTPYTKAAFTVTPQNPRALGAQELADCFCRHGAKRAQSNETIAAAVKAALQCSRETGTPLIALGTLYMYEEVRKAALNFRESP